MLPQESRGTLFPDAEDLGISLYVLYLKNPDELDLKGLEDLFSGDGQSLFLSPADVREAILARFPQLKTRILFRDFDLSKDRLPLIIQEIGKELSKKSGLPLSVSVVAPFFFLKRDGITPEAPPPDQRFSGLRLFANNYTLQGIKIKECKAVLNKVYRYLSQQEANQLDACPFLAKQDGIYVVDLSFIPEQYRLDVKNVEALLNKCLKAWLITVEGFDHEG